MTGLWDLKILLIPARIGLKINWSEKAPWHEYIHYFHVNPQILHNHCLQFLQGITVVHREIKDDRYAKFWGLNKVHYAWSMWKWWMEFAHSGLWTLGCVDLAWYNRQFPGFLAIYHVQCRGFCNENSIWAILPIKHGVLQRSLLGPVLLTIYVDDLINEINNSQIGKMYVDDY